MYGLFTYIFGWLVWYMWVTVGKYTTDGFIVLGIIESFKTEISEATKA